MTRSSRLRCAALVALACLAIGGDQGVAGERIRVSDDGRGFVFEPSGRPFVPWGFNYDHDESGRLIEDYWDDEWETVVADFEEMRDLGANLVRIHLQTGKFMQSAHQPNEAALAKLADLVAVCERLGLYLDLTGLGCYHKQDVPPWYDDLDEPSRWQVQARFWAAIAQRCRASHAVFCYDLMNEPVVPGPNNRRDDWLGRDFAGKHFVQFITLDTAGRPRHEVAQQWIRTLTDTIRRHDPDRMITVGLVPWSLDRPGLTSGFDPQRIAGDLDFVAMHLYPERGSLDEALDTLAGFAVGKPVVIEETFPLRCSPEELGRFIDASRDIASGWIGFYWGKPPDELRADGTIRDNLLLGWLELFQQKRSDVGASSPAER